MPKIVSTMTDSVDYADYHKPDGGGTPELKRTVTVKGGANRADKRLVLLGEGQTSRKGIETEVTDEELAFLQGHPLFQTHVKNGFIEVVKSGKADPEKVAKNMEPADKATQLTEADLDEANPAARLKGHKLKAAKE